MARRDMMGLKLTVPLPTRLVVGASSTRRVKEGWRLRKKVGASVRRGVGYSVECRGISSYPSPSGSWALLFGVLVGSAWSWRDVTSDPGCLGLAW